RDRIANLLASRYPPERLEVILVSDGSTDQTAELARAFGDTRLRVLERPVRTGKAECLNAGVAAARGEIVVFADARQQFDPDTLARLVAPFRDARVGAVSGQLLVAHPATAAGGGVDAYWRLERRLREAEARWDSCIGCTGAVYAIRRALYHPLPPDTVLDDVIVPMRIAAAGYRVVFEPDAIARDPQPLEPEHERWRKRRTLAGNFQMLFRHPTWVLPWGHRLWWQLISHKYLRLAAPWLLIALLVANIALSHRPFYRALLLGQCAFYALALVGLAFPKLKFFPVSAPAGFVFLNAMAVNALFHYLRCAGRAEWPTTKNSTAPPTASRPPRHPTHV
ncbi:MAG: glycosyltransferase family 2 protein, partial [Verrucomicrobiales bacterium]|nr:glycosyltransferase family 2 protein [Verrucomicrobiales bacterium]